MTARRDTPVWFIPVAAAAFSAVLAWAQSLAAVGFGVLGFDRRFDAGSDNDWLDNYRIALWICATAVVVATLLTRSVFGDLGSWARWAVVATAAPGAGTVVPFLMGQAATARNVSLVDQTSSSIAQAAVVGVVLGAVTALILGGYAGSARALTSGAITGAAVLWIMLLVSESTKRTGPTVLGALELDGFEYGARVDAMLVSALVVGVVIAALVCLVVRREATATLVVAGLLTMGSVAATILAAAFVGPAPSGDHADPGVTAIGPMLLGGVAAYGLLATVAHLRRRSTPSDTVTPATEVMR
ncbi:hypothetical protein [Catellatospora vulcania]|uniref:hypothetical protein n=1 Tax=Catellatospora vulcania TaxID=1460450 RepID=UPI0012D487F3|nr:hypothetical protein [Catellatospora vulcania]